MQCFIFSSLGPCPKTDRDNWSRCGVDVALPAASFAVSSGAMPRKPLVRTDLHPYHLRARSNNRDWYDLPLGECYNVYTRVIEKVQQMYGIEFHAFVLMNNHFHALASTPRKNLDMAMRYFMTETSRGIRDKSRRINHVYGGKYKPTMVNSAEYYAHCLKYIFRNPVRAGVAKFVEDYEWSSIFKNAQSTQRLMTSPKTGHDALIPQQCDQLLNWLNMAPPKEIEAAARRALRRHSFSWTPDRKTKKIPQTELDLPWASRIHKR